MTAPRCGETTQHALPATQSLPASGGPITTGAAALVRTSPPICVTESGYRALTDGWYSGVALPSVTASRCVTSAGTFARLSYTSSSTRTAVRPAAISVTGPGNRLGIRMVRSTVSGCPMVATTAPSGPPASVSTLVIVAGRGPELSTESSYAT